MHPEVKLKLPKIKPLKMRSPFLVGVLGTVLVTCVVIAAFEYDKLPFIKNTNDYSAYFSEAGGIKTGSTVRVSGMGVGRVSDIRLEGTKVRIGFTVRDNIELGDRTEAAIKTKSLLGAKIIEIRPRGDGQQNGPISLERTTSAYQLPDALGDLTATISGLNTEQVSQSLAVLSDTFKDTPPDLKVAVEGVARFSQTLDQRDGALRNLLANANRATGVLAQRSDEVVSLVANTNALLIQLESQSSALDQISNNISAVARQLKGFIDENRETFKPALDKLNGVLTIVDDRKARVQESIKKLNNYAMSLGESVSSGPFFKAYLVNLAPGQFVQPFIDAAFSDLGVDPATLLPSQRTDPPVGQPGTPPLPLPFPRTGQGGEPRRNLPDAITGNQGDHPCLLPGTGCYPYREPPPAPPGLGSAPEGPPPVYQLAPGEVAPGPPQGAR